jgi:hypothetical protein
LEDEDAQALTPARINNTLGEMARPDHVGRLQVLVIDYGIGAHQRRCPLVMEARSLAAHALTRLHEHDDRLTPPMAPLRAPRHPSVGGYQRAFGFTIPTGMKDACAIGKSGERFYRKIYACFLSCHGQRAHRHSSAREEDIPAVGFPTDGDRLGRALPGDESSERQSDQS